MCVCLVHVLNERLDVAVLIEHVFSVNKILFCREHAIPYPCECGMWKIHMLGSHTHTPTYVPTFFKLCCFVTQQSLECVNVISTLHRVHNILCICTSIVSTHCMHVCTILCIVYVRYSHLFSCLSTISQCLRSKRQSHLL